MYILLKQYEKIGIRKFTVEELRDLLAIESGKYQLYADFKKRVIAKPQKELAKYCDIRFEFTEEKAGRRVAAIRFKIIPNQVKFQDAIDASFEKVLSIPPTEMAESKVDSLTVNMIYDKIGKYGVTKESITNWLKAYPQNQVVNGVNYTLKQVAKGIEIKNIAGYLHKMVQQKDIHTPVATPPRKHKTNSYQKNLERQQEEELAEKEKAQAYEQQIQQVIQALAESQPEVIADLQEKAVAKARAILPTATIENQIAKAHFSRLVKEQFADAFIDLT